jgi:hypothetical protein
MLSGLGAYDELPRSPLMLMVKSMPGPCGLVEPEGLIGVDPQPAPSARTATSEPTVIIRIMKDGTANVEPFADALDVLQAGLPDLDWPERNSVTREVDV